MISHVRLRVKPVRQIRWKNDGKVLNQVEGAISMEVYDESVLNRSTIPVIRWRNMPDGQKITVIIPALNEERKIGEVVAGILPSVDGVIVIDDGSSDRTAEVAREAGAVVVSHGRNRGVGAAFMTGRKAALATDADIIVNIDGDGQFDTGDIEKLVDPIVNGKAEFVTASRFKDPTKYPEMTRVKFFGNRLMSWMISRMTGRKFYDVSCGFRAYSREALQRLNLFGDFTYTQESFLDLAFKGVPIVEVPVDVRGTREFGKSRVASNLFKYGWQTFKIIVRTLRDFRPLKLFSWIAGALFIVGLGPSVFLAWHYITSGRFSPHKWAGFLAGFLILLASLSLVLGFILEMFARMRMNQEEILARLRGKRD